MRNFLFFISILIGFWSCSAPNLLVKNNTSDDTARILSYEPSDLPDPFIDSLQAHPYDTATVKAVLLPPPPPAFTQIAGHRVQVFASVDSLAAYKEKTQLAPLVRDSVYLVKENGFFKVQAGDYRFYPQADSLRQILQKSGYPKAWIPGCLINVPSSVVPDSARPQTSPTVPSARITHRVQIFVTKDEAKALEIVQQVQSRFDFVHYKKTGMHYKIFCGRFSSREQALKELNKIKADGWPDAFIVPVNLR